MATEEKIRQCWAYSKDGVRCEHPAAHSGDHVVEKSWTDEECSDPNKLMTEPEPKKIDPVDPSKISQSEYRIETIVKCVACGHAHKNGECKCGCHEFIG